MIYGNLYEDNACINQNARTLDMTMSGFCFWATARV